MQLPVPKISAALAEEEQGFVLKLTSDVFAPFVELNLKKADGIFSDNYFHITGAQPITVRLEKKDLTGMRQPSLAKLKKELTVRSLRDSY
jgi:beta-mannosidase